MVNQRYENLLQKAKSNQLTVNDLNEIFLAVNDKTVSLKHDISKNDRSIRDIEEEYPLLPPEADDLSNAVRKKGVQVLGGKKSLAYQKVELRRQVYRDIYTEIKRQYGLINDNGTQKSYKKLKRKYLNGALGVVSGYEPPIAIENAIVAENDLDDLE